MSLVNAVHTLLEVAAGRRNLSPADADALHDEIDGKQPEPEPEPVPEPTAEELAAFRAWQASKRAAAVVDTEETPGAPSYT